ncbi:MAG: sigma 54-interacting transcriptional regulator [Acidobacteria bacterium]|nr:sigma 54-interacting transcriptional regulator [Acidobacteriota bacterium]
MRVRDFNNLDLSQPTAVTLGTFDGLHRGHQALLDRVKKLVEEKGLRSLVLTFSQPPQNHVDGKLKKKLILPLAKKLELLAEYGIDEVVIVGFQEICAMSPLEFAERVLKERLKAAEVVVGYDCRFGKDRAGDGETLKTLGSSLGFGVTIVEPVMVDGVVVSSTEVRRAIEVGDVERAARLLGYCPFVCGTAIQDERSSRGPGSSRLSLAVHENLVTPDEGLFMVKAGFPGREEPGVLYVRECPRSPGDNKSLELYLLNSGLDEFNGAEIEVKLVRRLQARRSDPVAHPLGEWMRADIEQMQRLPEEGEPMLASRKLQPTFLHQVLTLASRPATRLEGLLQVILERALALTASDAGGGIFVVEIAGQEPALVVSALGGELTDEPINLLTTGKQNPSSPALMVLDSGRPYGINDYEQDASHVPLLAVGRSSLWVPLLEEKRTIGVIHVESSRARHYNEQHLSRLQDLAAEAVWAIDRLRLRERMAEAGTPMEIVGVSRAFLELEREIKRVAACSRAPVLILGERGSGKELAAWAIHCWGNRRDKPFVPVLAAAFADSLFADELFGHVRYAFTDAARERLGKFKAADGGTIFFDEIGDMSPAVQSALLRIVERGELPRIGSDRPLQVDVRVMAATNQDPARLLAEGRLRQDLYDRLSVFEIRVPPLRERREAIPHLATHFLRKHCPEMRRPLMVGCQQLCQTCQNAERVGCATAQFYEALQHYDWPGNVRELENVMLRLLARVPDEPLDVKHVREQLPRGATPVVAPKAEDWTLEAVIRNHIEKVLQVTNDNRSQAAAMLGLPVSTLQGKIKKLGIQVKRASRVVTFLLAINGIPVLAGDISPVSFSH